MNTIVYTLVSHNFRLLPAQVAAIRKHVDDLSRIVVVQGPFGAHDAFSAGSRCLLDEAATKLGVEIEELETCGGLPIGLRVPRLIEYVKLHAVAQPERFAFVLHSDTFPAKLTNAVATLAGFPVALRGRSNGDKTVCCTTWAAFDTEDPAIQQSRIRRTGVLGPAGYKLYHTQIANEPRSEYYPIIRCDPSWIHLGRGHRLDEDESHHSVRAASEALGMELPYYDPSIVLDGTLPFFRPRMQFPRHGKITVSSGSTHEAATEWISRERRQQETYLAAMQRWADKGSPLRDDATTDMIYEKLCTPCPANENDLCTGCGCDLRGDEEGLRAVLPAFDEARPRRNKIRLATEHCPLWKW